MATSVYFNNYNSHGEQNLIEDLIVESIKIMGFDAFYLPIENPEDRDILYGEDPVKKFRSSFPLEMYLSDASGYEGQQDFFSKFGLEIRDVVKVILSRRSFQIRVPQNTFTRPREGDLVYVPFLNGTGELYEITFVEQAKDFHQLGRKAPYFYELSLEKFKYSQEIINTGTYDIDKASTDSSYTLHLNTGTGTGTYTIQEIVFQSLDSTYANANTIAYVQSWIPSSNTLSVTNIAGEFIDGLRLIGKTSNAQYTLTSFDPLENPAQLESYDNFYLANTANSIIDFSETNPFGSI
jgi:uncharacterized phage-like protein YoqJ